ncbi:MAG: hypothetical protein LIO94_07885 [Clostridiales bacterium]|nr:hypothetical protein [Clostridiales bacterium]
MKLNERLSQIDDKRMVYLACVDGSSFFEIDYCENVRVNLPKLDERMESLARRVHKEADGEFCWEPIGDREIVEEYPHTVDIPGTTLVITGKDAGKFWFYHEAEEARKR